MCSHFIKGCRASFQPHATIPRRSNSRPTSSLFIIGIARLCFLLTGRGALAQLLGQGSAWDGYGLFGKGDNGDQSRWTNGIDRGGKINCRIGERGGNCSSPENCILKVGKREEEDRNRYCMHERMERPYLGRYFQNKSQGVYTCSCCNHTLFHSSDQFNSGRGYLSFWSQTKLANVGYKHHEGSWWQHPQDTGVHCENCGAHIGNVREDGPAHTGRRYTINSDCVKLQCELPFCARDHQLVYANEKIAKTWRSISSMHASDVFEVRLRRVVVGSSVISVLSLLITGCICCVNRSSNRPKQRSASSVTSRMH